MALSAFLTRHNSSCFTLSWHYLTRYAAALTHYRSDSPPIWITFKQGVELAGLWQRKGCLDGTWVAGPHRHRLPSPNRSRIRRRLRGGRRLSLCGRVEPGSAGAGRLDPYSATGWLLSTGQSWPASPTRSRDCRGPEFSKASPACAVRCCRSSISDGASTCRRWTNAHRAGWSWSGPSATRRDSSLIRCPRCCATRPTRSNRPPTSATRPSSWSTAWSTSSRRAASSCCSIPPNCCYARRARLLDTFRAKAGACRLVTKVLVVDDSALMNALRGDQGMLTETAASFLRAKGKVKGAS